MPPKTKPLASVGGLTVVPPPAGWNIEAVWADPASIVPHELNPKDHPGEQTDAIGEMVDAHGWIKPFLYNKRTGKLTDGHARLKVALDQGHEAVPVWVGDWTADEEAEIIALLDATGRLAVTDPGKLSELLAGRAVAGTAALASLMARLRTDGLKLARPGKVHSPHIPHFGDDPGDGPGASASAGAGAGVRSARPDAAYPLAVILTRRQFEKWQKIKALARVTSDSAAFVKLLDLDGGKPAPSDD